MNIRGFPLPFSVATDHGGRGAEFGYSQKSADPLILWIEPLLLSPLNPH